MGTPNAHDQNHGTVGVTPAGSDRYAGIRLENGSLLVYDVENQRAWLQSELAVDLETVA